MIYLLLAILSSAMVSVIMRLSTDKVTGNVSMLAMNYLMCFVIGGSFGLADSVKQRADMKLSMSKMTFPHRLFRVMLLETIYRSFTIIKGTRYHK